MTSFLKNLINVSNYGRIAMLSGISYNKLNIYEGMDLVWIKSKRQ